MPDVDIMQVLSVTNILLEYNWYLNFRDNKVCVDLGLQNNKKYWRYIAEVVDELSYIQDFFLALIIFVIKDVAR